MAKKVAVLAVNPVNGHGLFNYLEEFYENGIPYKVFAVSDQPVIRTNSGIEIKADATIYSLSGHEGEYDALVFACGDAVPKFGENATAPYNVEMMKVIKAFGDGGKLLIGHCAAALMFGIAGVEHGKRVAVHPFVKNAVTGAVATPERWVCDEGVYTAQTEREVSNLIQPLLEVLR